MLNIRSKILKKIQQISLQACFKLNKYFFLKTDYNNNNEVKKTEINEKYL